MPRKAHSTAACQDQSVVDFIEAIIFEAELQARLTDAFLRANGIDFRLAAKPAPNATSLEGKIADFFLGLGGALRALSWERAGLKDRVSPDLPCAAELFRALGAYFITAGKEGMSGTAIGQAVLARALFRLSRAHDGDSNCDMVLMTGSTPSDVLDELAVFLWSNRNLSET
jgi:hypothetical protein